MKSTGPQKKCRGRKKAKDNEQKHGAVRLVKSGQLLVWKAECFSVSLGQTATYNNKCEWWLESIKNHRDSPIFID